MLPSYCDCSRMAAANQFRDIILDAGYNIENAKKNTIYTILGKVNHKAAEYMQHAKINGNKIKTSDIEEDCIDFLSTETLEYEVLEYEKIIPNHNHAIEHVKCFIMIYNNDVLPKLLFPENADPKKYIELFLSAKKGNYDITGHIDTVTTKSIIDIKNGKILNPFHTQLGGYGLLADANNIIKPKYLVVVHIPRTHIDKQYPGTKFEVLDVDFCKAEASAVIDKIIYDLEKFKINGDCRAFAANPLSMLCDKKYCRAYGTNFCEYFKK